MVRLTDLPPAQAKRYAELECPSFATTPWVNGPPLAERCVAIVSSAGPGRQRRTAVPCARRVGKLSSGRPERSSLRNQERKPEETSKHWYLSYRTCRSTIMHIFKRREQAIAAAYRLLNRGYRDALEVGPMSGNSDGKVLDERDLSQRWEKSLGAPTSVPFARGTEDKLKNLTTGAAVTFEINLDNWRMMEYLILRSPD
jgi:hypothetical protein